MHLTREAAASEGLNLRRGGSVDVKAVASLLYRNPTESSTANYAASKIAARFNMPMSTARVVAHLAGFREAR